MSSSMKKSLADKFYSNHKLNKKALRFKKSWDEVCRLIHADKKKRGKK